jgi:hypothetical protein
MPVIPVIISLRASDPIEHGVLGGAGCSMELEAIPDEDFKFVDALSAGLFDLLTSAERP